MRRNLVDEYVLLIHPLVLGTGRRLFADGGPTTALRLVDPKTTTTGVVIATYRPDSTAPAQHQGGTPMKQYLLSIYQPDGDRPRPRSWSR